jgi:hypothetical protein
MLNRAALFCKYFVLCQLYKHRHEQYMNYVFADVWLLAISVNCTGRVSATAKQRAVLLQSNSPHNHALCNVIQKYPVPTLCGAAPTAQNCVHINSYK